MRTVIVLCEDYTEAQWLHNVSFEYLEAVDPFAIELYDRYSLRLKSCHDDYYIFIDRRYLDQVVSDADETLIVIDDVQYLKEMDGYPIENILCLKFPYKRPWRYRRRVENG